MHAKSYIIYKEKNHLLFFIEKILLVKKKKNMKCSDFFYLECWCLKISKKINFGNNSKET